ncbi:unnamed protein product [Closterium sp. NIES-65]|nr:unnamed protein product [Closterium sp. NIES-65]
MVAPNVLKFDAEGRAVDFEVWVDDLQLFLQCDSKDQVSLFYLTSGASTATAATANSNVRSQWTTRDAATRLAIRSHLPSAESAQFSQYKTARTLYDAVVARYSSPATAALSRLMMPYLFPDLTAFATVADLITHLRTSDTRNRAALPADFCAKNPPPMYITLYYLVTWLSDSLCSVKDHFLSPCPTEHTVDLLEERLLAAEKSIIAIGASRGDPRAPSFEGCSPSPLCCLYYCCRPRWHRSGVAIFDLDFDDILAAMYAVSISAKGDYYLCVPPDPGIEAAALGASDSTAPSDVGLWQSLADPSGGPVVARSSSVLPCPTAPSGSLSGLHLPSFSTNLVAGADLQDGGVHQFTPAYQRVTHCTCAQTGRHLATFTRRPGSSL